LVQLRPDAGLTVKHIKIKVARSCGLFTERAIPATRAHAARYGAKVNSPRWMSSSGSCM
jgi:hypothetical protein